MNSSEILFVDDDREILAVVGQFLSRQGYRASTVDNGRQALELVKKGNFAVVFTDLKMPEFNGLDLLRAIKKHRPEIEVIIVTGHGSMESAIKAMKLGSYDYLQKPFKLSHLKKLIDSILGGRETPSAIKTSKRKFKFRYQYIDLVGISHAMQEIYETIDGISGSSPAVFVQGESGSGKELTARVIHKTSDRRDQHFLSVNCGSVERGYLETKLFSKALAQPESPAGGTIYLNEISEIESSLQLKLVHLLERSGDRLPGDRKNHVSDVRLIAGTNRDPRDLLENGGLRKDLFNLLDAVSIKMPPLRDRKEDICPLINHFLARFNAKSANKILFVSSDTMDILLNYHWPGNVIQLENVIERAFALGVDETIQIGDLPSEIRTFGEISKIN